MSTSNPAAVAAFQEAVRQLEATIPGLNATRYLSVAGLVVLLYDHLLLLGDEVLILWPARLSWSKALFIFQRVTVPLCLVVTMHELSGLSTAGLSDATWLGMASFMCAITLSIANVFVVQRVYALWGRSKRILMMLCPVFVIVNTANLVDTGFAVARMLPHVSYSPVVRTCIIDQRPTLLLASFGVPICFDVFLFVLIGWNAFDRPRHMQTVLVKQLYLDGVVFFSALLTLRLFNIILISAAPLAYIQLGVFFIWSMITALINRMLITINTAIHSPGAADPAGRPQPNAPRQEPFELSQIITGEAEAEMYGNFVEIGPEPKARTDSPLLDIDWKRRARDGGV